MSALNDIGRDLVVFPYGEEGNMVDFSKDGKTCLVLSTLGRETTGLVRMDVATGKVRGRGRVQGVGFGSGLDVA